MSVRCCEYVCVFVCVCVFAFHMGTRVVMYAPTRGLVCVCPVCVCRPYYVCELCLCTLLLYLCVCVCDLCVVLFVAFCVFLCV